MRPQEERRRVLPDKLSEEAELVLFALGVLDFVDMLPDHLDLTEDGRERLNKMVESGYQPDQSALEEVLIELLYHKPEPSDDDPFGVQN